MSGKRGTPIRILATALLCGAVFAAGCAGAQARPDGSTMATQTAALLPVITVMADNQVTSWGGDDTCRQITVRGHFFVDPPPGDCAGSQGAAVNAFSSDVAAIYGTVTSAVGDSGVNVSVIATGDTAIEFTLVHRGSDRWRYMYAPRYTLPANAAGVEYTAIDGAWYFAADGG